MAALWSSWFNDVLPDVPGALQPVAEHAIRRAAQEFFKRSKAWKIDITITAQADVSNYVVDPGAGLTLIEVLDVPAPLSLATTDEFMRITYGEDWRSAEGTPRALFMPTPGAARLFPTPSESGAAYVLQVAVMPSDSATSIPDDMAERYREGIAAGALSRLMLSAKKPYSDDARGQMKRGEFEGAIGKAIEDRATGFGAGRVRRRITWM